VDQDEPEPRVVGVQGDGARHAVRVAVRVSHHTSINDGPRVMQR
jgi:hypothetical protein